MAQAPDKPKNNGRIGMPPYDSAMLKVGGANMDPPPDDQGDKGPKAKKPKRPRRKPEPKIAATSDEPDKDDEDDFRDAVGDDGKSKDKSIMLGAKDGKKSDDAELLARARKRFERCIQGEEENRKSGLDDLKFKAGQQWPPDVMAQRATDKRPCLTINKLPTFVHQITNDQRQNRPGIDVAPVGEKGDRDVAKMYKGMIRAIERDSSADIAYDTAFDNAVSNGWGYFRLLTEYESDDSFNQVLVIKRVRNPFTVYLDANCQEPDAADAKYGFVTEMVPKAEFEADWPDAQPVNFDMAGEGESYKNWIGKDEVRVAEYYEIVAEHRKLLALSNGAEVWEDELHDDVREAIDNGTIKIENERVSECHKTMWYKLTAIEVLERAETVFRWVPIIRVIGDEIDIEGKVKFSGIIRNAKDPQRMVNYWTTMLAEVVALVPKAPYIVEEGQIEGHESQWKNANVKNYPFLSYKATSVSGRPTPPPQRQPPAQVPTGIAQAKQDASQDMMTTTGIRFDATLGERMVDESGRAMQELQRKGDIGAFHFVDNLGRALKHLGRIMIDAIPKVYDTKRTLMILREDGSEENVTLDPHASQPYAEVQNGMKKMKIFNPNAGKYGVTVVIGPSYATKRIEAAQSMLDFARALPNTAALIADLIAKNQDWEGAQEMADRLAKAVPPQLLSPDQKDIPPQLQAVMQHMDEQIKALTQERQQLMAALQSKDADRAIKQDQIDKTFEANLLKIVEEANANQNTHLVAQMKEMNSLIATLKPPVPAKTTEHAGA